MNMITEPSELLVNMLVAKVILYLRTDNFFAMSLMGYVEEEAKQAIGILRRDYGLLCFYYPSQEVLHIRNPYTKRDITG